MFGSVAVLVTVNGICSFTVCVPITGSTGAMLISFTITVKLLVAIKVGLTESNASLLVTTTVTVFVLGLCVWPGVHVKTPLLLMFIPSSGLTRPYPVVTAWMFGSVAVLVTVNGICSFTVCVPITGSTGAMLISFTITVKLFVAVNVGLTGSKLSLFVTTTVIVFVPGLCIWLGAQVKTPLLSMFIPCNALIRP